MPGKPPWTRNRRGTRIPYTDEEGNRKVYIGDPKKFKPPKTTRGPEIKKPTKKITAYKGGGSAQRGLGRAFQKGGKV
jgi:hypothetical protein|tara:strand:+ start:21 stop:251 length:231 start_codon:yes stop_codon:yes gene_type:complete